MFEKTENMIILSLLEVSCASCGSKHTSFESLEMKASHIFELRSFIWVYNRFVSFEHSGKSGPQIFKL